MRIGIDATSWANRRGFGRFARNAIGRLIALDPTTEYVFVIDEASVASAELPDGVRVRAVRTSVPSGEAAAADSARSPADLARLSASAARGRFDAFLFPSVYTYFPVPGTPEVVGIHDAIADQLPHLTLPTPQARAFWRVKEGLAVRRAKRIFTVSEASRAVLEERFGIEHERLAVVPEAPDPVFKPRGLGAIQPVLDPLGLEPGRFFLFAGGVSPHKNVVGLVEAYADLRDEHGYAEVPPLVIVGDLTDDPFMSATGSLTERIAQLGLGEHVVLPGFVTDEALACLYSAATAVVLPSLVEGFGLPAVEAAACGAAVLLSDLEPHRASLGESALYFDPEDVEAIGRAMAWALDEPGRTETLGYEARARVAPLTWDATARALKRVIQDAVL
jgi:glycosyltransferase involved in cell wall biosynthesis